jgi:hypothetical protein
MENPMMGADRWCSKPNFPEFMFGHACRRLQRFVDPKGT